jgi:hypothetical protein
MMAAREVGFYKDVEHGGIPKVERLFSRRFLLLYRGMPASVNKKRTGSTVERATQPCKPAVITWGRSFFVEEHV